MSASCSCDGTHFSCTRPCDTSSWMNAYLMATCFVRSLLIPFSDSLSVDWLSPMIVGEPTCSKPISLSKPLSHLDSLIAAASAYSSASQLDCDTIFCFLLAQL